MPGYDDRVEGHIVRVPFRRAHFEKGEHFSFQAAFQAVEGDSSVHMVPLHRVRELWHDGSLIWHREGAARAGSRSAAKRRCDRPRLPPAADSLVGALASGERRREL